MTNNDEGKQSGYQLVKSWTKKVNLFEKDFLIIPINENLHWYLAIICHPSRILNYSQVDKIVEYDFTNGTQDENVINLLDSEASRILIFDSLGLTSRGKSTAVINKLRTYLQMEAQDKLNVSSDKSKCTGHVMKVPQQNNYTDCGCFLLQFVEEFFKGIPEGIVSNMINCSFDFSSWFPSEIAQNRREIMKNRIKKLAEDNAIRQQHKAKTGPLIENAADSNSSDIEEIIM